MCKEGDTIINGFNDDEKKIILIKRYDIILDPKSNMTKKQIIEEVRIMRDNIDRWFD